MADAEFATTKWDLHIDVCPCDAQFNAWIDARKITDKTIFHFGTGAHHLVGKEQATNGSGNRVFGITASTEEHDAYVQLLAENARIGQSYHCYFGDIYRTNRHLLPDFDIVTLFHLCEFFWEERMKDGIIDSAQVLDIFTAKTRPGGYMLFYTKSRDFWQAGPLIETWAKTAPVERVGEFELLLIYRKKA